MKYIESPDNSRTMPHEYSIFMAGGITGCPDWQREMTTLLKDVNITLFNPRRKDFPIHDPSASGAQIEWEHSRLRMAMAILFWFPCETLNPIVLYELGAWSMTQKPLFVGVHPDYKRRQDVEIQTKLARPEIRIVYSLEDLSKIIMRSRDENIL